MLRLQDIPLLRIFPLRVFRMRLRLRFVRKLRASVRNPIHVTDCALAGADIATVPYGVIEQMTKHPLTDQGIEKFQKDYKAVFGE